VPILVDLEDEGNMFEIEQELEIFDLIDSEVGIDTREDV
jgi:hypothetical protein